MVTLALDTSTLIEVMRGRDAVVQEAFMALDVSRTPVVASVLVLHELLSGAASSDNPTGERGKIERVLSEVDIIPLIEEDVEATAKVRSALRLRGRPIGDIDVLIAGQALARGWMVVTRNVRHFGRVEGLPIIDWSVGPNPLSAEMIAERVDAVG